MNNNKKSKKWWAPIVHFAVHAGQGAMIFMIIAVVSLGIGVFVDHLKAWGASDVAVYVFSALENIMVVVDAVSFLWYILKTAYIAIKEF